MILAYSNFLDYAIHYVILRTLYTGARGLGISPWLMVGVAVALLFLTRFVFRGGVKHYERRSERPGRAYRVERARQEARRDVKESDHTRGRWRF